jgi:SOS-response transcriptional repressor LexA
MQCQLYIARDDYFFSTDLVERIGERIAKLRGKLSQRQLAVKAGIEQATLSRIERGEMDLVSPHVARLAKALAISPEELLHERSNVEPVRLNGRLVPVLDFIQAGTFAGVAPYFRDEEMTDFIPTMGGHSEDTFALRIRGESMTPDFREGDIVVIDPEIAPQPEDFVVGKDQGGEATFKRYHRRGVDPATGNIRFDLVPLNSAYETLHSTEQHIEIVGTMVEHHRYRRR